MNKNIIAILIIIVAGIAGYLIINSPEKAPLDSTPQNTTLSGTYVCLPHTDTSGPQTDECAFGLKTDDGLYYAVNFGESASVMEQFQANEHITAEGFVVIKEALSSDHWAKYNMKGIFTITKMIKPAPVSSGKLNITVVCESALAYMTFPDSASADTFIAECKEGKHPEVIKHYKAQMGLGDGAAI